MELDVKGFAAYLQDRVSDDTADRYVFNVGKGPQRIRNRQLAPKYLRQIRSSFRAYARYLERAGRADEARQLLDDIEDVRLPPALRQTPQNPLPRAFYDELRAAIKASDQKPAMRAQLGIMANRGLRRGDVLRIQRKDVQNALKTGTLSFVAKGKKRLEFGVLPTYAGYLELMEEAFERDREDAWRYEPATSVWELLSSSDEAAKIAVARSLRAVASTCNLKKHGVTLADVRPHVLRRSYAQAFFEACGHDPMKLKDHMQWSDVSTAMSYLDHSQKKTLDEVAAKMFG